MKRYLPTLLASALAAAVSLGASAPAEPGGALRLAAGLGLFALRRLRRPR